MNGAADRDAQDPGPAGGALGGLDRGDTGTRARNHAADAILDYPQSGERFRGRPKIQAQRGGHPAERRFTVLRIRGGGDLWVSECVITYDGVPTYAVSVMSSPAIWSPTRPSTSPTPSRRLPGGRRWLSRSRAATDQPLRAAGDG